LLPDDAAALRDVLLASLEDADSLVFARALHFFLHVHCDSALERTVALLAGVSRMTESDPLTRSSTLAETAWQLVAPTLSSQENVRELARAHALSGFGSRPLFRALAQSDSRWFFEYAHRIASANPEHGEEVFQSLYDLPPEFASAPANFRSDFKRVRWLVRYAISETLTLDQALERTSFPFAAWDTSEHYKAYLCIFSASAFGAMQIKGGEVDGKQLEDWNDRARARQGRVGATHRQSEIVWMFDDDECGVWNGSSQLVRGDDGRLLLAGSYVPTLDIWQVSPFLEITDKAVHRGVRCVLSSGKQVLLHEEYDDDPPGDPDYSGEAVEMESAWIGYLAHDLATWLGVPSVSGNEQTTNTRALAVRARLIAFAAELLSRSPELARTELGSYDGQDLSLRWALEPDGSAAGVLALVISDRGSVRERIMKRGGIEQITWYLRHFITPRRLLAGALGGY
jgi:hypothetical protein